MTGSIPKPYTPVLRELLAAALENIHLKQELEQKVDHLKQKVKGMSLLAIKDTKTTLKNLTASQPHVAELKHKIAKIDRVGYSFNDSLVDWNAPYLSPKEFASDSETDTQSFILNLLRAISYENKEIKFVQNRRIIGIECDIVLLYGKNRIPFAVVEIKKDGGDDYVRAIFDDAKGVDRKLKGKVQGEHFDQLEGIKFFGFTKVFGLISDGNHSMITCTDQFGNNQEMQGSQSTSANPPLNSSLTFINDPKSSLNTRSQTKKIERIIYCSDYSNVEKDKSWENSINVLAHFLKLAEGSIRSGEFSYEIPLKTPLPARKMRLDGAEMFANATIKFEKEPDLKNCLLSDESEVENIFLFKHLGMGQNGDCCLATTESGHSFCAVKFFSDRKVASQSAEAEVQKWHAIYTKLPKAKVVRLPHIDQSGETDFCLCMPYLIPIESKERHTEDSRALIKTCLEDFAKSGYHHNEVKWHHLGFFGKGKERKVYLCDLSDLVECGKESDEKWIELTKAWINKSLQNLDKSW